MQGIHLVDSTAAALCRAPPAEKPRPQCLRRDTVCEPPSVDVEPRLLINPLAEQFRPLGLPLLDRLDGSQKLYADVEPYRLINHSGVWYLAAMDGDKIKVFSFNKIDRLLFSPDTFERAPHIEQLRLEEDSSWPNEKKTEIILKVTHE